jgi:hypothetical protein
MKNAGVMLFAARFILSPLHAIQDSRRNERTDSLSVADTFLDILKRLYPSRALSICDTWPPQAASPVKGPIAITSEQVLPDLDPSRLHRHWSAASFHNVSDAHISSCVEYFCGLKLQWCRQETLPRGSYGRHKAGRRAGIDHARAWFK